MSGLSGWLIGILSIVVLGTVVDLMLGNSKMSKYVRSVFAAVTVLVIVLPLPSLIKNGIDFDSAFVIQNEFELDESYLAYAERVKLSSLARGIEEQLDKDGVHHASVTAEGSARGSEITVTLVRVNLKNVVIDENKQHIHKNELIQQLVAGYLLIEKGQVIIHGD